MRDRLKLHQSVTARSLAPAVSRALLLALGCCLCAFVPPQAEASPGQLDAAFAGLSNGSVGANVMCHAVAPDGKFVLAGSSGDAIVVTRRLANGNPDTSFGGDGTVSVTHPDGSLAARSVAVQADGKIVVAGQGNYDGFRDFLVVRLTTSGSLDPSFSANGFASAWVSTSSNNAEKVLIQPDGKIVVVGTAGVQGDWDFAAARFLSDGALDTSFSGDGMASVNFGWDQDDQCFDAVLQADGKLVMVGGTEGLVLHDEDFALARLHINGSLDSSFDGDGKVQTGFGDFYDRAYAVAIQPSDLRIVVVGQGNFAPNQGRAARYYSSDGSLDGSFDGDGKMNLPLIAHDAVVNTAGKITLIGIDAASAARALRLNFNGSLDPEWQSDGDIIVDNDIQERPSLSLLADGRVLTVLPKGTNCWLRQYWAHGYLDLGGQQAVAFNDATFPAGSHELSQDMVVQADGKVIVAGEVSNPGYTETDFGLARFHADGRLDTSFGTNGRAALSLGNYDYARAMVQQPDGKLVVAGYTGTGNATNFMIARFLASGALDTTFGFGGFNALDFMGGADFGWALALQPDGKILVAGTVFNGARNVYGVARFHSNGTLDNSFDLDGKQLIEFSVGPSHWASAILVQAWGRIVVGGSVGGDFALVGLTSNGSLDTYFGFAGKTTRDLGGSDYLEALVMGMDDRIYAAGTRVIGGNADWALVRWTASAGLFPCTPVCPWTAGFVDFGSTSGWANDLRVRSDGNLVIAGSVGSSARWAQFSPSSPTPVASGTVSFPGNASTGMAVGFSGANKVLVAGSHTFQGDHNMTLARFETIPNTAVAVEGPELVGPSIRLAAPFPNPLVGRSTLAFDLPRRDSVQLAIFDVAGRRVRKLHDGVVDAGRHQHFWDGSDEDGRAVAAGVYYARLVVGTDRASAPIVVLR